VFSLNCVPHVIVFNLKADLKETVVFSLNIQISSLVSNWLRRMHTSTSILLNLLIFFSSLAMTQDDRN